MSSFKMTLISCQQCRGKVMVRAADAERGYVTCTHVNCGAVNYLSKDFHYDETIVRGLPSFGQLTYEGNLTTTYPLQFGENVVGTGESCEVQVERFMHDGRCFVSRRHATITVTFDKWTGKLRYQLQDGAVDTEISAMKYSLNGTRLNGALLSRTECIDVGNGERITLGSVDRFQLTHYAIPPLMLNTYKVALNFNPDRTE